MVGASKRILAPRLGNGIPLSSLYNPFEFSLCLYYVIGTKLQKIKTLVPITSKPQTLKKMLFKVCELWLV